MFNKLILFLVFLSCALHAIGRSIPHGPVELDQPSYNDGVRNDWKTTSTLEKVDQTNEDPAEQDMLAARGILDGLKNKVNQGEKTAEKYKDKAKEKINEAKKKAEALPGTVMNKLPGIGKRTLNDLENIERNNIELLDKKEHEILNIKEDQANEEEKWLTIRGILDGVKNKLNQAGKTAEKYKDKSKEKINEAKNKAEALPGTVMNKLPGGLVKVTLNVLRNEIKKNIILPSEENEHGILEMHVHEDETNNDPEEDMLAARGILDGLKNKVNQVEKAAEEYKDKAKGKINEAKDKAKALPGKVMGGLGKRTWNDNNVDTVDSEVIVENDDAQDVPLGEVDQHNDERLGEDSDDQY